MNKFGRKVIGMKFWTIARGRILEEEFDYFGFQNY
jgi:hypothetical protein